MRYDSAAKIAVNACKKLQPFCEVINIVGSLRRALPEISDIDLICVPKYTEDVALNLFGSDGGVVTKRTSISFSETVKNIGTITKGAPDGRYMSIKVIGYNVPVKIDIFMPDPIDYYRQYCIRTGSANFVHWNIAKRWSELGWCGTDQGLRRIEDCREIVSATEKKKWEVVKPDGDRPPAWESEEHFFDWLGVKWIAPRLRTI